MTTSEFVRIGHIVPQSWLYVKPLYVTVHKLQSLKPLQVQLLLSKEYFLCVPNQLTNQEKKFQEITTKK